MSMRCWPKRRMRRLADGKQKLWEPKRSTTRIFLHYSQKKDSVCNKLDIVFTSKRKRKLDIVQQDYAELLKNKKVEATQELQQSVDELKVLTQNKDHEISTLQAEALEAKKQVQKMHSLVKEKDEEIQRLKGQHPESVQKHNKDTSKTHKKFRSGDPAVTVRDKPENSGIRQTVEEDYISETKTAEKDRHDETAEISQKRRRVSSMSNDDEMGGSDDDDYEHIGSDEDGDKQTGSDEDGDKQSGSDEDGDKQSGSDEDGGEQSGSGEDEQSGSGEDEQSESGEDKQSGSGEDGDGDDNAEQSGSDEETTHNQVQKHLWNPKRKRATYNNEYKGSPCLRTDVRTWWYWKAPAPLRSRKLKITNGRRFMVGTGHWGKYVRLVNDSLVDQPDKHKMFVRFL